MPSIQLHIKCSKNMDLIMSPRDLLDLYFYGIDTTAKDGSPLPDHIYKTYILSAQQEIEKYLGIKLLKQVVEESHTYNGTDWRAWGLIQTSFPALQAMELKGYFGKQLHTTVPKEWLSTKFSSTDMYHRSVWLIPNGSGLLSQMFTTTGGIIPSMMLGQDQMTPNYWKLKYVTGYDKLPMDLVNVVGKMAAMNVFNMLGDLVLGLGVTSQSIGVDGLSQSVSSNKSATSHAYSARVNAYAKDLEGSLPKLKEYYTGIKFTCA